MKNKIVIILLIILIFLIEAITVILIADMFKSENKTTGKVIIINEKSEELAIENKVIKDENYQIESEEYIQRRTFRRGEIDKEEPDLKWTEMNKPKATNGWMDIYGNILIENIQAGDLIGIFDSNGKLIFKIEYQNISYGFIHIYLDDITTEEKDGFIENETMQFRLYDRSENKEIMLKSSTGDVFFEQWKIKNIDLIKA